MGFPYTLCFRKQVSDERHNHTITKAQVHANSTPLPAGGLVSFHHLLGTFKRKRAAQFSHLFKGNGRTNEMAITEHLCVNRD